MEETDNDYDLRQYRQTLRALHNYQGGSMNLTTLIQNLDALYQCLREAPQLWKRSFESEWGTLEDVYAIMLDKGEVNLDDIGRKLVDESINKLESIVNSQLEKLE